MNLPHTTLFMLMSLDGKISTGAVDDRDFDKDLPNIVGLMEGLQQYYDLEKETEAFSFITGRVMAKVGWNDEKTKTERLPVSFIVVDSKPHLSTRGIENLLKHSQKLYIVTTNPMHPAFAIKSKNLKVLNYSRTIDFVDLFEKLKQMGIKKLTVQSGGEMNATLLNLGLINGLSIVIAPILIGGRDTPSLIGGDSITSNKALQDLCPLELEEIRQLENSYLHAKYKVLNSLQ